MAEALVIATQQAAQDGSYQSLVSQKKASGVESIELQMLDRILDGGKQALLLGSAASAGF